MYLVITRMPGENYCRRFVSLVSCRLLLVWRRSRAINSLCVLTKAYSALRCGLNKAGYQGQIVIRIVTRGTEQTHDSLVITSHLAGKCCVLIQGIQRLSVWNQQSELLELDRHHNYNTGHQTDAWFPYDIVSPGMQGAVCRTRHTELFSAESTKRVTRVRSSSR